MKMQPDVETQLKAAKAQSLADARMLANAQRLSMGRVFVRGRAVGAARGRTIAMGLYVACGGALAAITCMSWLHPGHATETARVAALVAGALWTAGFLRLR